MSKQTVFLFLFVVSACGGQEPAEAPPTAAPPSPPPSAAPEAPAPEDKPAAPSEAPAAAPEEVAQAEAPEAKPAGTSQTSTGQPKAEPAKPAEESKPAAAAAGTCGEEGQPMCPLQAFMEKNLQGPMDVGELDAVSQGLIRTSKLAPDPSWNAGSTGWAAIAKAGAAAADAGDEAGAKQSCKSCHKAFRNKYKAEFRTKPL